MFVAEKLRKNNIAEWLIYMWSREDFLRAFHLDFDKLNQDYLSKYSDLSDADHKKLEEWYRDLIRMMRSEHITEKGHLQICKNVILNLEELHNQLTNSSKYPFYRTAYYDVLPMIVELRRKNGNKEESELDTCFSFLYGVMLLRMQKKPVSADTEAALKKISTFVGMLTDYYDKDKENPLEF